MKTQDSPVCDTPALLTTMSTLPNVLITSAKADAMSSARRTAHANHSERHLLRKICIAFSFKWNYGKPVNTDLRAKPAP